jgi:hypothetical protein
MDDFFNKPGGKYGSSEVGTHGEGNVMGKIPSPVFLKHQALARLLLIWAFLVLLQAGGSSAEAGLNPTTTTEALQPLISQPVPLSELRDNKTGGLTLKVQSLEDVMKVLTSSLPNKLEASVQRTTTEEDEKYGLRLNQGVVIGWLDPKGPLGRAGLHISDIILQVDNQPIEGLEDFVSLVDSLGTLQTATFSVLDNRTGSIRHVRIVVGEDHRLQKTRGNFLGRHVDAAAAGIKKTARSLTQHVDYAAEMGKEAITTVIQGLKKWAGKTERGLLVSVKKGDETSAKPEVLAQKAAAGPR